MKRKLISSDMQIQYSGGHRGPSPQGGFYASGRSKDYHPHRPEMLAMEADVAVVSHVMGEVQLLEEVLQDQKLENSLQTRSSIKKLITSHPFVDSLARLECARGEPIWGLSMNERKMVTSAREKVNQC
jgi:hypothetical protein